MEGSSELRPKPQRRILIATDGSKAAESVVDFGIEIARCSGAKVYAVYVIDISFFDSVLMDESWVKNAYEQFERVGRDAICCVEGNAKAVGVEATPILLKGNTAEKILDFSENQKVDMIVIGSTGKSGAERFMLGSVSEKVVRNSKIPVLVVRERFKPESFVRCGQEDKKVSANIASEEMQ
ncbi:universal stress protein [Methanosarcina sp. UBA5]|uniref:universal stress protein n=1 Tax=Methanosarcina sp. UBA5 TaxID=1915593 RepID=UPI0025D61FFF|nr:universal stress protein [Methanosarcina sp. UBA5]